MRVPNLPGGMRLGTGLLIGVGAFLLAPIILPAAAGIMRTLTKSAIKGGFILYERGKEAAAEMKENLEDISAEVREELTARHGGAAPTVKKAAKASTKEAPA